MSMLFRFVSKTAGQRPQRTSRAGNRLASRPRFDELEDRLAPAVTSFAGGVLTINYAAAGEAITVTQSASGVNLSGTTFTGSGGGAFAGVNRIVIADTGNFGGQSLTFAGKPFNLSAGLSVAGPETITVDADISSGTAAISLASKGDIVANRLLATAGAPLSLGAAGDITLRFALATAGGAINVVADSDMDGQGALTISTLPEFIDPNPASGNSFGLNVVVLPGGNVVITSPGDDFGANNSGAVYLFNGTTGALISTLRGSSELDRVGQGGVVVLANGDFVVKSPTWNNSAGAVTWGSGVTGISGVVSAANSLVGSKANDNVGLGGVTALNNGNYVVCSPDWDNSSLENVGAVTWGSGAAGVSGIISTANSLVGSTAFENIGFSGVMALSNGNYLIRSPFRYNGANFAAGAVTWGDGTTGIKGTISADNSLIGSATNDRVGEDAITVLTNGNFVVKSPKWDNGVIADAGALTWGNAATGISGVVSAGNSLVGSTAGDNVGLGDVIALRSGNYVAISSDWDNGAMTNAGAVTWGNGATGITGVVSAANSLVGSSTNDYVGGGGVTQLTNGNYVVASSGWHNGAIRPGAVTWASGLTGISGLVSAANSLVGNTDNDSVGSNGVTALSNGNYVVKSQNWQNGGIGVGAATWGNGATGSSGFVSAANSLIGSAANDQVGGSVIALSNGNYVVASPLWDRAGILDAGAATWGNGATGSSGVVSSANSLVGSKIGDRVSFAGVTALTNGNYVVQSIDWDNGPVANAGAATWGNGATGISGDITVANSLVGGTNEDDIGLRVIALTNGNYVVASQFFDNGAVVDAGAATWGNGATGIAGVASFANSLVGNTTSLEIGFNGSISALSNGNYVVVTPQWTNAGVLRLGAVTWGKGTTGVSGQISAANSLVGSKFDDRVGENGVTVLANGNYIVTSANWNDNNGALVSAGAVTWGNGATGTKGAVSAVNSIVGRSMNSNLQTLLVNTTTDTYFVRFLNDGGGRVLTGSQVRGTFGILPEAGSATLTAGAAEGIKPTKFDTDAIANSVSFPGSYLDIAINGTVLDSGYSQLNVLGTVNLTGGGLILTGSHVPSPGQTFTIVSATTITGFFNGRANGSFLVFNGVHLRIDYTATAVTLTVAAPTSNVYVDDDWNAMTLGQLIADADPTTPGNQPATFGITAFADAAGLEGVGSGKAATIFAGTYSQNAALIVPMTFRVPSGAATLNGILSGPGSLIKLGSGTLILGGTNTLTGGMTINGGKLQVSSDANFGHAANAITADATVEIVIAGSTTSGRLFDLNDGSLIVNSARTLIFSGGGILDGFVKGAGTIATVAGQSASFVATDFASRVTVNSLGSDAFINVDMKGTLNLAAGQTVSLDNVELAAGGQLGVNGTANVTDFVSYGDVIVGSSASLVSGGGLTFGGGSTTTILASGSLNIGFTDVLVAGGLVKNSGSFGSATNSVIVDYGGKVTGPGTFGAVITQNGGVYSPGNSPGPGTMDTFPINGGGTFLFEISNAAGTPGNVNGWDMATVAPTVFSPSSAAINISATPSNRYTILIDSKLNDGVGKTVGPAANFNPALNYAWKFLDGSNAATTVNGTFDPTAFNIVANGFQNAFTGTFSVERRDGGKSLYLVYTAPAPTITSIAPFSGPTTGGTTVIITGTGFVVGQTSVTVGPNPATNVAVNPAGTQITATTPAAVNVGTVEVVVTTPAGSSSTAGTANDFTYTAAAPTLKQFEVNGGPMWTINSYGEKPTGLAGKNSIVEQLYVTFDLGVTTGAGAFTIDAGPVAQDIFPVGGVTPVAAGTNVVAVIVEPDTTTLDGNGGYKGYRLRFSGSADYLNTFDNGPSGTGGVGNVSTTLKDGFYKLNINGSAIHAGNTLAGTPMTGTATEAFWVMYASYAADDRDVAGEGHPGTPGDGTSIISVNASLVDFARTNGFGYGTSLTGPSGQAYNANFDWNLDGDVGDDLIEFAKRFGAQWSF